MNDDYLWDRTGELDPEIQQLEQALGTLRYQPRPLELPAQVQVGRPRTFFTRTAIAAAMATILVGGAVWVLLHRQSAPVNLESASSPGTVEKLKPLPEKVAPPAKDELSAEFTKDAAIEHKLQGRGVRKSMLAGNKRVRSTKASGIELTARDRAEAEAGKEQLLLALRVASSKLSLAQKKAQVGYPGNLIRNQHKIG